MIIFTENESIDVIPTKAGGEKPGGPAIPEIVPVLPIRGTVTFPGTIVPLGVGRPSSRKLLDESLPHSKVIVVVAQRDEESDDPSSDELYTVGTLVTVLKLIRQPDDTVSIIVHGISVTPMMTAYERAMKRRGSRRAHSGAKR